VKSFLSRFHATRLEDKGLRLQYTVKREVEEALAKANEDWEQKLSQEKYASERPRACTLNPSGFQESGKMQKKMKEEDLDQGKVWRGAISAMALGSIRRVLKRALGVSMAVRIYEWRIATSAAKDKEERSNMEVVNPNLES